MALLMAKKKLPPYARDAERDDEFGGRAYVFPSPYDLDGLRDAIREETGVEVELIAEGNPRQASQSEPATIWVIGDAIGEDAIERALDGHERVERTDPPSEPEPEPSEPSSAIEALASKTEPLTDDEIQEALRFLLGPYRKADR
jgi:hypothetical protein